jgi:hypothetical protein
MYRRALFLLFLFGLGPAIPTVAQDLSSIQIYSFVTQGLLYSTNNNWYTTNSTNGSVQWTDGAIRFNDSLTDHLRVGIQSNSDNSAEIGQVIKLITSIAQKRIC